MSKSLGNVIPPQKVMNDLGADVLRLWVSATDFSAEMSVSDENLKRTADSYRRIRNTARFLLANLEGFNPETDLVPMNDLVALDRWAVSRASELQQEIIDSYDTYQLHNIYQKLHNFCIVDMGGFYLDIIKDRQYTTGANSVARRSAQTALYHIAEAFTRWIAPILSYTADELWDALPKAKDREDNVFLAEWYDLPKAQSAENESATNMDAAYWTVVAQVKDAVNKAIESTRNDGLIGKSLTASVTLYCSGELFEQLSRLQDELRFVLITSSAIVSDAPISALADATDVDGLSVMVEANADEKCVRCWHQRPDVGQHTQHPELCGRCVDNIDGEGEVRHFA
jgi:isoleucyl-tRNA synthetase